MTIHSSQRGAIRVTAVRPSSLLTVEGGRVRPAQRQTVVLPAYATTPQSRNDAALPQPGQGAGGLAPSSAAYLVGEPDSQLTAERVVTDTLTVLWDLAMAGQAKANVVSATGTFLVTGTGFTDPDPTGTAAYVTLLGLVAVVFLPELSGTSDAATFTLTGIPSAIQPATLTTAFGGIAMTNNNANVNVGYIRVNAASGTWDLFPNANFGTWVNLGAKALLRAPTLTYLLS
jgi:hypothetical protein